MEEARKNEFKVITNDPWGTPLSPEKCHGLAQTSLLAPSILNVVQLERDTIPCRVFKNIADGCMCLTNSKFVYDYFGGRVVYDSDPVKLFHKAALALKTHTFENQVALMDIVKENHTYVHRIKLILEFIRRLAEYDASLPKTDSTILEGADAVGVMAAGSFWQSELVEKRLFERTDLAASDIPVRDGRL